MFTGLVETMGTVREVRTGRESIRLGIVPDMVDFTAVPGGSVSVSGVCLTLEQCQGGIFWFTAVAETLRRSTLANIRTGERVNLERALAVGGRIEGHFVLGHVDGVGRIVGMRREGDSVVWRVAIPRELMRFMAEKGSVALDGVSLTVVSSAQETIEVALVPHTLTRTTMSYKREGANVNVECDVLARYLAQLLRHGGQYAEESHPGMNLMELMARAGF